MDLLEAELPTATAGQTEVSMHDAETPQGVPGWDRLASDRSFYVAADWLRLADTDGVSLSRYFGLSVGGRLVAALSSHWAPEEIDADYVAARTLQLPGEARGVDDGVLTMGGRRGFLSSVLIADPADDPDACAPAAHLADLIRAATERAEAGAWWWPYLTASDADVVLASASQLAGRLRPGVHLVGADCVIDVFGKTIDDHMASLATQQRRTNFRREAKRFAESRLELRQVSLSEHWPRLGVLLAAVQEKYGHKQSAEDLGARLRRQGENLASHAVVFACFDGDTVVGFALAYRWGGELALRVVGFDYERLAGADEYAQLAVHAPLRYCYQYGLSRLHLGTESYEAKCRRGARVRPLWAVTSLPGSHREGVARVVRQITTPMPAHESDAFTADVAASCRRWSEFLSS